MRSKILTVEAVAERLTVTPHTVRKMLRDGRLTGVKLLPGNPKSSWRITETALENFANGVTPKAKTGASK